ncbi:MAG TPA: AraC family transcriptional regulator [Longimicrobium sp.]|nr:AraC family transcriptional regulator [Longimicrobium sp.]
MILVLHTAAVQELIGRAAADGTLVSRVSGWPELDAAILTAPPSTIAVVDPYEGAEEAGPSRMLRDLLRRLPSTSVVPVLHVTPDRAQDVALLDEWGIAGVISTGHDDTASAVRHRLRDACVRPLKRMLASMLPASASPRAFTLLSVAADVVADGGSVSDFADALGASPSTLLRWCDEAHLPNPRTILQWVRVLLAAKFLDEEKRTLDSIAVACGYASTAELRKVMLRLTSFTPAQLRTSQTALEISSTRFLESVRRAPSA